MVPVRIISGQQRRVTGTAPPPPLFTIPQYQLPVVAKICQFLPLPEEDADCHLKLRPTKDHKKNILMEYPSVLATRGSRPPSLRQSTRPAGVNDTQGANGSDGKRGPMIDAWTESLPFDQTAAIRAARLQKKKKKSNKTQRTLKMPKLPSFLSAGPQLKPLTLPPA